MSEGGEPDPGARFLRLLWCDSAGLRRCKVIPMAELESTIQKGLGLTKACMACQIWADTCAPGAGLGALGEVRLMPVGNPIQLPWHPQHAICLTSLHDPPGGQWSCCPRAALARTIKQAVDAHGLEFHVGFETELHLSRRQVADAQRSGPDSCTAVDNSLYADSLALDAMSPVLDTMAESLERMGIGLVQFHAESGSGQFEVVTQHASPLIAADQLLLTREALTQVAARKGFRASLHPKPHAAGAGSGCHCHISLRHQGEDGESEAMHKGALGLTDWSRAFFAGMLAHLPGLMVFTMPSYHSYLRMQPGAWSGAYRVWGEQNKEAPLRLCTLEGFPEMTNMELKSMDSTTNPYIALAAVITAGLLGITKQMDLPHPYQEDPSHLSPDDAAAAGLEALPNSLAAALEALDHDKDLLEALEQTVGAELLQAFLGVRKAEAKHFDSEADAILYQRY
ncbi:hypothetical protein WJX74_006490 [Apatococcus lobatus]|uniref:GS catalytic domain-containing protein n=1 Tax=Apatococcus lobatus TaxID=904363 RepID=A0AAW1RPQ2_9CHLO